MRIPINRSRQKPLYKQIRDFIEAEISTGVLPSNAKLPSTRKLAIDLGVNRITVVNAYAELEAMGLVRNHLGSGTYVQPLQERNLYKKIGTFVS